TLPSGKSVGPEGILILARKRDASVTAMNRALRTRAIGTAGADRIPASTHIAALDLLALADVMLLAEDDLQLAACLKSPLIGLTEDELMRLAGQRERLSLWSALQAASERPFRHAAEQLAAWRSMADQVTPFRFFATVLGPDGGRRRFRERLGAEADDVLDAFLSRALAYESVAAPTLQGFVGFVRASSADIKREAEEGHAGVRIMTVHGAKGLEADVVFLVDTGSKVVVPSHRELLVPIGGGALLWRRSGPYATVLQRRADAVADAETECEYLRLLYVAMTRAKDVLYVAGIRGEQTPPECWYSLVEKALVPAEAERDPETGELAAAFVWPPTRRPPLGVKMTESAPVAVSEAPDWLLRPAASPAPVPRPLVPSHALAEPDPPSDITPAAGLAQGHASLPRGRALHRLLGALPAIPEPERRSRAARMLERDGYAAADAETIIGEAEAVIAHPVLSEAFGPDSRGEVPIVGRVATDRGDYAVSGRIDRLARTPAGWLVVDFKTNREVPSTPADAEPAYVLQLALYRRLLMEMDPRVDVRAMLVWTAGPNVMPIPDALMEHALAKLGISAMSVP
ncbi:MAG TPA: 3'-5' exonuclease, partial [Propylenella sp.]|nr:3'-5' exonuclease [Propylenella sp.]